MVLIENEGALFRGPAVNNPTEVWSIKANAWKPYASKAPKPLGWGEVIDQPTATAMIESGRRQAK